MTADLQSPATLRFSVVVPAHNEADDLPRTLRSLQQQDFRGSYEVIVVDNASTDRTAEVAEQLGVRVVREDRLGVCAARQRGTDVAAGEIVVSTDADTVHDPAWLSLIDAQFRSHPRAVAVAGPCRYAEPTWWAGIFPPLWFAALAGVYRITGRVSYLTATNVAFRRQDFPGYDTALAQGGDEMDLLRRLRRVGPIVWDAGNPVTTSSRRMDQGLLHTLFVSFGYHYAWSYLRSRRTGTPHVAPAIRRQHAGLIRRRRQLWRMALLSVALGSTVLRLTRSRRRTE
jgi:glycosyltransferase involved in cell wall biosynthesis